MTMAANAALHDRNKQAILLIVLAIFLGVFTAVHTIYLTITIRDAIPYIQAQYLLTKLVQNLKDCVDMIAKQGQDLDGSHHLMIEQGRNLNNVHLFALALALINAFHIMAFVYLGILVVTTFLDKPNERMAKFWGKVKKREAPS